MPLGDFSNGVDDFLFVSLKIIEPLVPHFPQILSELVLLKVENESDDLVRLKLFSHISENVFHVAGLINQGTKALVELLTNGVEVHGFLLEAILELAQEWFFLELIETKDIGDLNINPVDWIVRFHLAEVYKDTCIWNSTIDKVLLKVGEEVFDYFWHIVVNKINSLFTIRSKLLPELIETLVKLFLMLLLRLGGGLQKKGELLVALWF